MKLPGISHIQTPASRLALIILTATIALYLALTLFNIEASTFDHDEAVVGHWGLSVFKGIDGHTPETSLVMGAIKIPLNIYRDYYYALQAYLAIPFFVIFGINILAVKLMPVFLGALSLILIYCILSSLFDRRVALITLILHATSPTFIHYTRIGNSATEPVINFFFFACIWFIMLFLKKDKISFLYAALLSIGLGLSVKLSAITRILGLSMAALLVYPYEMKRIIKKLSIRKILLLVFFFSMGSSLFLLFNLQTKGRSFHFFKNIFSKGVNYDGVDNTDVIRNIEIRIQQLGEMAEETSIKKVEYNNFFPLNKYKTLRKFIKYLFFILLALMPALFYRYRKRIPWFKTFLFIYILYLFLFLMTIFSPGSLNIRHVLALFPFIQLVFALFICFLADHINTINIRQQTKYLIKLSLYLSLFGSIMFINFATLWQYHSMLLKTGGRGHANLYMKDMISYLKNKKIHYIHTFTCDLAAAGMIAAGGDIEFSRNWLHIDTSMPADIDNPNNPDNYTYNLNRIDSSGLDIILERNTRQYFILEFFSYDYLNSQDIFKWTQGYLQTRKKYLREIQAFHNKVDDKVYSIFELDNWNPESAGP